MILNINIRVILLKINIKGDDMKNTEVEAKQPKNSLSKIYLSTDDLEKFYSIKKSQQAKLRMEKKIPYVRPAGSKVCLYEKLAIDAWLNEWKVS